VSGVADLGDVGPLEAFLVLGGEDEVGDFGAGLDEGP
jgi:hypothetical protein